MPISSLSPNFLRSGPGGEMIWKRGSLILGSWRLGTTDIQRADTIRARLASIEDDVLPTDTLIFRGAADFGSYYSLYLPPANYVSKHAHWYHDMQVDGLYVPGEPGVVAKTGSTCGISLRDGVYSFTNFTFTFTVNGDNPATQDGGGIGWSGSANHNGYDDLLAQNGTVTFTNCIFHGETCDWLIFSWGGGGVKVINLQDCTLYFCRFGVAAAYSGGMTQTVMVDGCAFICVVDGSHATGYTGLLDPVNGAVACGVLNRGGESTITNSTFDFTGMVAEWDFGTNGCERIAAICTDRYAGTPQPYCRFSVGNCTSLITPNISTVWNDIDVRQGIYTDMGGNSGMGAAGALKIYA